jgi:magnesium-transporting ATPase (P-type)
MAPDDKASLIEQLGFGEVDTATGRAKPGCGYYTGYCGDGANDLGALKGELTGTAANALGCMPME